MSRMSREQAEQAIGLLNNLEVRLDHLLSKQEGYWWPNIESNYTGFSVELDNGCSASFPIEALYSDDWLIEREAKQAALVAEHMIELEAEQLAKREALWRELCEEFGSGVACVAARG